MMNSVFWILVSLVFLGVTIWFVWEFAGLCDNVKEIRKVLTYKMKNEKNKDESI